MPSRMKDEALLSLSVFGSLAARHCKSLRSVFITTLVVYLIEPDRSLPHPFRYALVHPVIGQVQPNPFTLCRMPQVKAQLFQVCLHEATEVPQHYRGSHDEERVAPLGDSSHEAGGS